LRGENINVKVVLYKGKSWTSKAIRFLTRSPYSHASFMFDEGTQGAMNLTPGCVIEAWEPGGVRQTPYLNYGHEKGTPVDIFDLVTRLDWNQEAELYYFLKSELGTPYGFWNVLKFISKRPGNLDKTWFCSELVFAGLEKVGVKLFDNTAAWEVPPDWIARSVKLVKTESKVL
jgi:uncharacterized protein YycO